MFYHDIIVEFHDIIKYILKAIVLFLVTIFNTVNTHDNGKPLVKKYLSDDALLDPW